LLPLLLWHLEALCLFASRTGCYSGGSVLYRDLRGATTLLLELHFPAILLAKILPGELLVGLVESTKSFGKGNVPLFIVSSGALIDTEVSEARVRSHWAALEVALVHKSADEVAAERIILGSEQALLQVVGSNWVPQLEHVLEQIEELSCRDKLPMILEAGLFIVQH
jgi:hypothetical protein